MNQFQSWPGYSSLKSEVKYGAERSRIDFMLPGGFASRLLY